MTESAVAFSAFADSVEAGKDLAAQILNKLGGKSPDALIVFASSKYNYEQLLQSLEAECKPRHLIGCSSAGEFIGGARGEGAVSALALKSSDLHFSSGLGEKLSEDRQKAAAEIASSLQGSAKLAFRHRSVLLLADALAGHTDQLIEALTTQTAGRYQFFGGGAGDDAKFSKTHVFYGTKAFTNAVVSLEILSHQPIGIGVQHGWVPAGEQLRVTEADGMKLVSLNSIPTVELFREYAASTHQEFDPSNPVPFFLHNVLGIRTRDGYKLRVPLSIEADGSVICASNVPNGATVSFMKTTSASSIDAAEAATQSALKQIEGRKPGAVLFFDCVATRLRMGQEFGAELQSLEAALGSTANLAGCNTYGQIARVDGQFSGFHNCTAVVCVLPES